MGDATGVIKAGAINIKQLSLQDDHEKHQMTHTK
jgi:hypothetical protein